MKLATAYIENQPYDLNVNIEESLNKGSAWNNLYIPYKFESNININALNKREQIKYLLMCYNFQIIELNLYLDTHKNNGEALKYLQNIITEYQKLAHFYQMNYSNLVITSNANKNDYNYIDNPWPWEGI